jgi:hypothetical protein
MDMEEESMEMEEKEQISGSSENSEEEQLDESLGNNNKKTVTI